MFRCDEKKANWYLKRKLGTVINNEPLIVRLNFKPKGLGNHNKDWGLSEMPNKCVVCGNNQFLTKHHVVPSLYKKYFPLQIKSHNFHDVLSVCVSCHEEYESYADELKLELSSKYNAPINGEVKKNKLFRYSKMASTLLRDDIKIPNKRIIEMKNNIKSFFGIKRLTKSRLLKISDNKKPIIVIRKHGEIVVDNINDIQSFVELWREHFIKNMNPKFLPKNWSVKNNIYE